MKISPSLINSASENLSAVKIFLEIARRNHFKPKHKPKFIHKPVYRRQEKESDHASLIASLQKCKSIAEQIKAFQSVVKLPVENINLRYSVCEEVERILQPYFPSCFVRLVGSSVNDFGSNGCDIDLSIQFNDTNPNEQVLANNMRFNEELETEIVDSKIIIDSSRKTLLTIRKILQNLKYEEPLTVIPARCPILNFNRHSLSCDLSVNNSLALQSTNLMLLCGRLDERIIPLVQIIKYWAKHLKLVGGLDRFKTYAIFLMVIYFLQTRNPPIMPSLEKIFEKSELLKNFGNWSYDVTKYVNEFKWPQNNDSIELLLKDFFFFYRSFDYSQIICPLSSSCMSKTVFTEKTDCSNDFQFNAISIQDPFEKARNVTSCVDWEHSRNFIKAIISATEMYQDQYCWIPGPYSWGLACLIDQDAKEFCIDIPVSSVANTGFKNNIDFLIDAANKVKYILSYCLQAQCYHLDKNTDFDSLEIPPKVKVFIKNCFQNLNSSNVIKDSLVRSTDCYEDYLYPNCITQYICCVTEKIWCDRQSYISSFDQTKSVFDNEHEMSTKMLQEKLFEGKEKFYLLCKCYGVSNKGSISLRVKIKPLGDSKFNRKSFSFFKKYILKLMDRKYGVINIK